MRHPARPSSSDFSLIRSALAYSALASMVAACGAEPPAKPGPTEAGEQTGVTQVSDVLPGVTPQPSTSDDGVSSAGTASTAADPSPGVVSVSPASPDNPATTATAPSPTAAVPGEPAQPVATPGSMPDNNEVPDTSNDPTPVPVAATQPTTPEAPPAPAIDSPSDPVDCSVFSTNSALELCGETNATCSVVYTDGSNCTQLCQLAGLACIEAWENDDSSCAPDTALGTTDCSNSAGHASDYCVCGADGTAANLQPNPDDTSAVQPSENPDLPDTPGQPSVDLPAEPNVPAEPEPPAPVEPQPTEPDAPAPVEPQPAQPNIGPRACGCETPAGEYPQQVSQTIVVGAGEVFDGNCMIFRANPSTLGAGNQDEGQSPVFRVNAGGRLQNVVLGASAADGIHIYGDATLENVHWLDIGEDALTIKAAANLTLDCGSAQDGEDKIFQVNAEATIHISNFTARNGGKFMRQNGGTTFPMQVFIDHCDISDMKEVIFRTDGSNSHVTLTNSRYSDLGKGLFMFGDSVVNGNSSQSTVENNQAY